MNILETVGKYISDFGKPGLALIFIPGGVDLRTEDAEQSPIIFDATPTPSFVEDSQKLQKVRAEAVEANQMRVLFIDSKYNTGHIDQEADVVLSVELGVNGGRVGVNKYRGEKEKPKDTYFIYEA